MKYIDLKNPYFKRYTSNPMKHLKTYENKKILSKLKKYVIWNGKYIDLLEIGEIDTKDKDILRVKHIYHVINGELIKPDMIKTSKTTGLVISELEDNMFRILYQSDNYNDCLNNILILANAQKYNL